MEYTMMRSIKISVIAVTAALAAIPLVLSQPATAQVDVQIGAMPPPPRTGAWGDRDRDGIPNQFDRTNNNYNNYNNNQRGGRGDQDHDGIANRYDTDRDGDGTPNRWDRNPANPNRR